MRAALQTSVGPTPVHNLPDTLLTDIFELDYNNNVFPYTGGWRPEHEKSTARAISKVCKRWNELSEPLLYRKVDVDLSGGKTNPRRNTRGPIFEDSEGSRKRATATLHGLFSNLYRLPHLRTFTREVSIVSNSIYASEAASEDVWQMSQLLRWWRPQLHTVTLHGSRVRDKECRPLFYQLSKLPLRHLTLSDISISFFLKYFHYPGLQTLRFSHMTWTADRDQLSASSGPVPGSRLQGSGWHDEVHMPRDRCSTSALESITLYMPNHPPGALDALFRWPAALKTVQITFLMHSPDANAWTPEAIQSILVLQAHSLRSITLGITSRSDGFLNPSTSTANVPNLASFTQLESLTLNEVNVFEVDASAAVDRLAAPELRHLTIDFSTEDQHDTHFQQITFDRRVWLLDFARFAQERGSCIQQIYLDFRPDAPYGADPAKPEFEWPWRKLQQLAVEISRYKVQLTWATPVLDEDNWYKSLRESHEHFVAWEAEGFPMAPVEVQHV